MIGENLLYLMVWMVIILVPVLNSKMLEEVHVSLENILIAWLKIAPYLLIFIIHNSLIAPRLLLRKHRYVWYLVVNLLTITAVFSLVAIYEKYAPYDTEPYILNGKASFTDLAIYWNILLGFFMTGLNMGIKLLYRSLRDEQQMEELKRQNLQAEMDYLRYQINPHFFFNSLNSLAMLVREGDEQKALTYIDQLSFSFRYIIRNGQNMLTTLAEELRFAEAYGYLFKIRYADKLFFDVDVAPKYLDYRLPVLTLQELLSNAVKHNAITKRRPLRVSIRVENGQLVVSNPLLPKLDAEPCTGIGLHNLDSRWQLITGHGIRIDRSEEIFSVCMSLLKPRTK